jgi:hypothetical protein
MTEPSYHVHGGNGRFDAPVSLTSEDKSRPMAAATVTTALVTCPKMNSLGLSRAESQHRAAVGGDR